MFTGIIHTAGTVLSATTNAFGMRLLIGAPDWAYEPPVGDSIAVNGCCLTYAPRDDDPTGSLGFDVIQETLAKTTFGSIKPGDRVNLETSVQATTSMAGHFVQGHVDAVGTVTSVDSGDDEYRIEIQAPQDAMPCIVPKGSVTINGVSLTIADVNAQERKFQVALIPTTLEITNLDQLKPGDAVNLECDIIARTVVNYMQHYAAASNG